MKNKSRIIRIGSRASKLALCQAEWVSSRLVSLFPNLLFEILTFKTSGDLLHNKPLSIIGGKGVFTKELEERLLDGAIDLAVHSMKDLPTNLLGGLTIAAIPEREDPRDALVVDLLTDGNRIRFKDLKKGAIIGTSSQRRATQIKSLRKDFSIKEIRGNVDTRLRKLDEGQYDALVLAAAGLRRLGLEQRINLLIPPDEMIPAVGQGALALETREDNHDVRDLLQNLEHSPSRSACSAERAFLRALGGGCQLPIAAHATISGSVLRMEGLISSPEGDQCIRGDIESDVSLPEQVGETLAARLIERGALDLLEQKLDGS